MARLWRRIEQIQERRRRTAEEHHREELHDQQMSEDAVVRSDKVEQRVQRLTFLLHAALSRTVEPLDFDALKQRVPGVDLGVDAEPLPMPHWEEYAPAPPGLLRRVVGRGRSRPSSEAEAEEAYARALERYRTDEAARLQRVEELTRTYHQSRAAELQRSLTHNTSVDAFRSQVLAGDRERVSEYFGRVFESVVDRSSFPRGRRLAYVPESKLLLIEWQVPGTDVVPREKEYRYNRSTDSVGVHRWRPVAEVRSIYHTLLAQLALRGAKAAFTSDPADLVETVVFNGVAADEDDAGPCLITMSTSRRHFTRLNLDDVDDPIDLVRKHCGAVVSPYPDERAGITPVLPYELADPLVASASASRAPNLATAPVDDFHRLVERLLERMGYSTRPLPTAAGTYLATQTTPGGPSRCVVHARRPAGATLDASEVRGLASALRRERADSGLLFTTGGLDPQAFEYTHGRPLHLYDAHSIVALGHQHALPVRIEPVDAGPSGPAPSHQRLPAQDAGRAAARVERVER